MKIFLILLAIASATASLPDKTNAKGASIFVNTSQVLHTNSPYMTGACLEDVNHEVYGGLYSQMVFGESFQEPASSGPLSGFTAYGGTWSVTNGDLVSANGSGPKQIYNGFNQSSGDVSVQLQFSANEGGDAGIIFQVSQPGVGADSFTGYEVSLAPAGYLVLGRHVQNFQSLSQVSCSVSLGQWLTLEVKYTNASISVLVNGSSFIQYTDTQQPLTSGQVGLRNYQQDVEFQSFSINTNINIPFLLSSNGLAGGLSGMWNPISSGTVTGQFSVETTNPFVGAQSQVITFGSGAGVVGIANQGLNRWGMSLVSGNLYTGTLDVRAEVPTPVWVALESADGTAVYAEQSLTVSSNNWQQLNFNLTPTASDGNGRFSIKLKQPGSVVVGYALLQPGPWGCYQGLPVRKDVVQGLLNQGVTVLRYGGSMVNASGYRWKNMIGPRDRRPPYTGTWYPYSTDGWGIPDFLNFCEAAGFLGVPDFNINETPQDMADFMQYVNGSTNTVWGAQRMADGHPQPYGLKYIELGNEERVDDQYFEKFKAVAEAIWAMDPAIILIVGDFSYHSLITDPFSFAGADSGIATLAAQQKILQLAKQHDCEVWFDLHVWTDGPRSDRSLGAMFSYIDAMDKIADGAKHKVVVFELNANNHSQRRALANALAINAIQHDGRMPIVCSANCLQPDGQNDNGWDQGLLFLNPSQVWLQPPGYVTQMISRNYQPLAVKAESTDRNIDVSATKSEDDKRLVLQIVNCGGRPVTLLLKVSGVLPVKSVAHVLTLEGALEAHNTASTPKAIKPVSTKWRHGLKNGESTVTFPAYSFTVIQLGDPEVSWNLWPGMPPKSFSHPLPHAVWEKEKHFRNPKFVRFVERAARQKSRS
jgi:alpha-L-arabinofuranosidase